MKLFRTEVLEHRADRLDGDVNIAIPVSWQIIGYTLLAALIAAFLFLAFASYARTEIVPGAIVHDRGAVSISATRPGVVVTVDVVEGQRVFAGAALVRISAGDGPGTSPLSSRVDPARRRALAPPGRDYVLTSPIEGMATAITARAGQAVTGRQPVMAVIPSNPRPRAELYVPARAAGFLAPGQTMQLAIDAFPQERHGTVAARMSHISAVAVPRNGADGVTVPVYRASAEIAHPWVLAFDRRQPLLPGMTLTARIETKRQSMFEWLFEPVPAAPRR